MANIKAKRARREAARRARRRRKLTRWGSAVALAVVAVTGIVLFSGRSDDQSGALAPDFELETRDGETVRLSDYRGQPVALTFMHTY